MRIAFIQMNCRFGQVEQNLAKAISLISEQESDLFVLPELFNTGYLFQDATEARSFSESIPDGPTCQSLEKLAQLKKCFIVAGLVEKNRGRVYNSSVLIGPTGCVGLYRKVHLFNEEKEWFTQGNRPLMAFDIGWAKIGMMICFDWFFPEAMRTLMLRGAEIICHPANLVLPFCQNAMVTRCLENGVFAITANRIGSDNRPEKELAFTGKSQITGPKGDVLAQAGQATEEIRIVEIDPQIVKTKNITAQNNLLQDRCPQFYKM